MLSGADLSHDADIARWEDEGATAGSFTDRATRRYRRMAPSERRVEEPTSLKIDHPLVEE
jgi:hypothetical protein